MKKTLSFLLLLFVTTSIFARQDVTDLLNELDRTVDRCSYYEKQKDQKLKQLKRLLRTTTTDSLRYEVCGRLYDGYNSFKSDSALKYARVKLSIAERSGDVRKRYASRLDLAFMLSITGMFKESLDVLRSIDKNAVPDMKSRYFDVSKLIYGYMADYAVDQEKNLYDKQIAMFRDSVLALNAPGSSAYVIEKAFQLERQKQDDAALNLLLAHFHSQGDNIRKKANIAFLISVIFKQKGDKESKKYWLTLSAIYDLQTANKEYISLRYLAYLLYEEGDIDRAYRYIKRSAEDALFCNARLRTFEVSQMLPLIDKAYQAQAEARQRQLVVLLSFISFLSLFLLVAVVFIYRQMRKLSAARKSLSQANEKLNQLNGQLLAANSQMQETNQTLLESNRIKEEYIGRYLDHCSVYIEKLDNYRRLLSKKATAGNLEDLLKTVKSKQNIDEELKELYDNFDRTFLQLFPTFVEDFTALLVDDEYVQLKPGQLLNTELRIYALMRLGITNGEKLSHFLRCSISTVYNYRTRIRNKAKGTREDFEERVMRIGKNSE